MARFARVQRASKRLVRSTLNIGITQSPASCNKGSSARDGNKKPRTAGLSSRLPATGSGGLGPEASRKASSSVFANCDLLQRPQVAKQKAPTEAAEVWDS